MLERTVNIAQNHKEAREWDIQQATRMAPEDRQNVVQRLKKKVYGAHSVDIREYHRKKACK